MRGLRRVALGVKAHVVRDVLCHEGALLLLRGRERLRVREAGQVAPLRDRFDVDVEDGEDLKARGNILDHEYEIKRDGDVVARVSKKWFRVRDTYGIEIESGEDEALILALTVAIDDMSHDRGA